MLALTPSASGVTAVAQGPISHPRQLLFGEDAGEVLSDLSAERTRWVVLFAPRVEACTPQEMEVVRALARLHTDFPELVIRTLLPRGLPERVVEGGVFGLEFPGSRVVVDPAQWAREEQVAPRPRLEVWSGTGHLLLLRSLPPTVTEESIYEEVLWTRAFTDPADQPPRDE